MSMFCSSTLIFAPECWKCTLRGQDFKFFPETPAFSTSFFLLHLLQSFCHPLKTLLKTLSGVGKCQMFSRHSQVTIKSFEFGQHSSNHLLLPALMQYYFSKTSESLQEHAKQKITSKNLNYSWLPQVKKWSGKKKISRSGKVSGNFSVSQGKFKSLKEIKEK